MGTLTVADFEQEIKSGSFRPAYVLLGPEVFLRRRALGLLKRSVLAPEAFGFNYSEYSLRTAPLTGVLNSAQTFPFGSPRRLVVATELEALKLEDQDELIEYLSRPFGKAVLVLEAEEMDRRTVFYRTIRERACVVECPNLKGMAMARWVEQFIRGKGLRISPGAVKKLLALAGSDLQSLAVEIEKLALYAGAEKTISDAAVNDLVFASRQHSVFELTGAIGRKDRLAALRLLGSLMESGEPALVIVAMIARHFRQLLVAKELLSDGRSAAEIAAAVQIPAFVLDDFLHQARSCDSESARSIYVRLAGIDSRMKSSRVDPRTMLEELICST